MSGHVRKQVGVITLRLPAERHQGLGRFFRSQGDTKKWIKKSINKSKLNINLGF